MRRRRGLEYALAAGMAVLVASGRHVIEYQNGYDAVLREVRP